MSTSQSRYKVLEHTADVGIEVFGSTLRELFENAAWGFLDMLTDASKVQRREARTLVVSAANREELLVRWLSELLFRYETERKLFGRVKIFKLTDTRLEAEADGETFDPHWHLTRHAIKAVTYHSLSIQEEAGFFKATVIFDV